LKQDLDHRVLKEKQRDIRGGFPEVVGLRIHRAISWIGRAEACVGDDDARFIFLWIAFNAAYADERDFQPSELNGRAGLTARAAFMSYFERLVALDTERRIYRALWDKFSGPVHTLLGNRYVFNRFWLHHNGIEGHANWQSHFEASRSASLRALETGDTAKVLGLVFDRLYVLRNQLVHGGSTWNSKVNRAQVRDGAAILAFLMPVFIDLMMDNPHEDWGRPFYPVVE
jgi:hypothetical protein